MGIIIQKFGGTSLANTESRLMALAKITEATEKGDTVVLVVSAMGLAVHMQRIHYLV